MHRNLLHASDPNVESERLSNNQIPNIPVQLCFRAVRCNMRRVVLIFWVASLLMVEASVGQRAEPQRDLRQKLSTNVPHYAIRATNLLAAAARIASDFNLPVGIEWQGDPGAKNEIIDDWIGCQIPDRWCARCLRCWRGHNCRPIKAPSGARWRTGGECDDSTDGRSSVRSIRGM